jgi:hypothetical protein
MIFDFFLCTDKFALYTGTDLNRIWDESSEHVHPTVHGVNKLIEMLSKLVNKTKWLFSRAKRPESYDW